MAAQQPARTSPELRARLHSVRANVGITPRPGALPACDMAVEQNTLRLAAIINLINQLVEPVIELLPEAHFHPSLQVAPKADCKRYEVLYTAQGDMA